MLTSFRVRIGGIGEGEKGHGKSEKNLSNPRLASKTLARLGIKVARSIYLIRHPRPKLRNPHKTQNLKTQGMNSFRQLAESSTLLHRCVLLTSVCRLRGNRRGDGSFVSCFCVMLTCSCCTRDVTVLPITVSIDFLP